MASSSYRLWQCSTCTFAKNEWAATACAMCGAIVHDKRPALPVTGTGAVVWPSKLSRKTAEEAKEKPLPPDIAIAEELHHPSGVIVEIVGMECIDQGRSYEEHLNCGEVMAEDVIVHLRKVQILVEGKEEMAIAAIWINDGINRCCVGFLPCHMAKHAARYNGAVAQCTRIFSGNADACDTAEHRAFHKNSGHCLAAIIAWPSHHRNG
jgi:hypothetical protein